MHRHTPRLQLTLRLLAPLLLGATPAAVAQTGGVYDLTWNSLQGSGGVSSGGVYTLSGEVGQPDAGELSSGVLALGAGFWAVGGRGCRPDINQDGLINVQDFLAFLQFYSSADARADFNSDGQVNVGDFLAFLAAYAAGCP